MAGSVGMSVEIGFVFIVYAPVLSETMSYMRCNYLRLPLVFEDIL